MLAKGGIPENYLSRKEKVKCITCIWYNNERGTRVGGQCVHKNNRYEHTLTGEVGVYRSLVAFRQHVCEGEYYKHIDD